jgi:lipid A 3-O-deacylase
MLKKSIFKCVFLYCGLVFSQNNTPFEIGLVLENDSFTSVVNDKYYTNGMELFYRHLSNKSNDNVKKIISFKAGQYIYNPKWVKSDLIEDHNRPYAGYLFVEVGVNRFYRNENVWITNFQLGVVGPLSQAEDFQKIMHNTFGFGKIYGWQFQIGNALGLQYNTIFSKKIMSKFSTKKMDFHFNSKLDMGTVATGITVGSLVRISLNNALFSIQNSNFYGASLQRHKSKNNECYLFLLSKINYQIYDATIQGSFFENNSPLVFKINPIRFKVETGIKYRFSSWNTSYSFLYTTNEIKNSTTSGFYYGSIAASYIF